MCLFWTSGCGTNTSRAKMSWTRTQRRWSARPRSVRTTTPSTCRVTFCSSKTRIAANMTRPLSQNWQQPVWRLSTVSLNKSTWTKKSTRPCQRPVQLGLMAWPNTATKELRASLRGFSNAAESYLRVYVFMRMCRVCVRVPNSAIFYGVARGHVSLWKHWLRKLGTYSLWQANIFVRWANVHRTNIFALWANVASLMVCHIRLSLPHAKIELNKYIRSLERTYSFDFSIFACHCNGVAVSRKKCSPYRAHLFAQRANICVQACLNFQRVERRFQNLKSAYVRS